MRRLTRPTRKQWICPKICWKQCLIVHPTILGNFEKKSFFSEKNTNSVFTLELIWFWPLVYIQSRMMNFATHLQPLSRSCTMFWSKSKGSTQKFSATLFIYNSRSSSIKQQWKKCLGTVWTIGPDYPLQWWLAVNFSKTKNPRKFSPSICFSVEKCDKAIQVNCGLSQATMQRLETVMLGPYAGHLLIIADIFQTAHGSVNFAPVLTFSLDENLEQLKTKSL